MPTNENEGQMKLTLSDIRIEVERRYKLDEPVVVEIPGASLRVTQFVTVTRTYDYGTELTEYLVHGKELKKDGEPKAGHGRDIALHAPGGLAQGLLPDPRAPFIEALHDAADEQ